jgi:hypothetical protein
MNHAEPSKNGGHNNALAREGWSFALVTAILAAGILLFYRFDPASSPGFWTCPFHRLTGWYCPGCGGQRALHELLHAHFRTALRLNALAVFVFLPLAAHAYAAYALRVLRIARLPGITLTNQRLIVLLVALILFGVIRNVCGPLP